MEEQLTIAMAKILELAGHLEGYAPVVLEQMVRSGILLNYVAVYVGWFFAAASGAFVVLWAREDSVFAAGAILCFLVAAICLSAGYVNAYRWATMPELMIVEQLLQ